MFLYSRETVPNHSSSPLIGPSAASESPTSRPDAIPILKYSSPPRRHLGNSSFHSNSRLSCRPHSWDFSTSSSSPSSASNADVDFRLSAGLRNRTYSVEDSANSAFSVYNNSKLSNLGRPKSDSISTYLKSNQKLDFSALNDGLREVNKTAKDFNPGNYTFHVPRSTQRRSTSKHDDYYSARNLSPSERILKRSGDRSPKNTSLNSSVGNHDDSLNVSLIMSMEKLEISPANSLDELSSLSPKQSQSMFTKPGGSESGQSSDVSETLDSISDLSASNDKKTSDESVGKVEDNSEIERVTTSTTFTVKVVCPTVSEDGDKGKEILRLFASEKTSAIDGDGDDKKFVAVVESNDSDGDKPIHNSVSDQAVAANNTDVDINQNKAVFPNFTKLTNYNNNFLASPDEYLVDSEKAAMGRYSPRGIVDMEEHLHSMWETPEEPVTIGTSLRRKATQVSANNCFIIPLYPGQQSFGVCI